MSECEEIADSLANHAGASGISTFDDAVKFVKTVMPDESMTVIDNTAESLYRRKQAEKNV